MSDEVLEGAKDVDDLHAQAKSAIEHRVMMQLEQHIRGQLATRTEAIKAAKTSDQADDLVEQHKQEDNGVLQRLFDAAKKVYEAAIERRGAHQAATDALQGAVGLPLDPHERQIEVEKRESDHHEAQKAAANVGTGLSPAQLQEQNRINEGLAEVKPIERGVEAEHAQWGGKPSFDKDESQETEGERADRIVREQAQAANERRRTAQQPQTGEIKSDGSDSRFGG